MDACIAMTSTPGGWDPRAKNVHTKFDPLATAEKTPEKASEKGPFTLPHFRKWAHSLKLDNGEPWVLEQFQESFIADLFAGRRENWLVVPEENAKTTLISGLALYHCKYRDYASVPIAASSREQVMILFAQAEGFVTRSGLGKTFECLGGTR